MCFFLMGFFTHKITTHNKRIMINKAAPPTDPAIIGMENSLAELVSLDDPV